MKPEVHTLAGGEISLWAEQGGSIMIKLANTHGDPVELGEQEAAELISALNTLLAGIS